MIEYLNGAKNMPYAGEPRGSLQEFSAVILGIGLLPSHRRNDKSCDVCKLGTRHLASLRGISAAKGLIFFLAFSPYVLARSSLVSLDVFKPAFLVAFGI
jgi:hypothetical protein